MNSAFSFFPAKLGRFWPDTTGLALLARLCCELCYRAVATLTAHFPATHGHWSHCWCHQLGRDRRGFRGAPRGPSMPRFVCCCCELGSRLDLRSIRRNPWLILSSVAEATQSIRAQLYRFAVPRPLWCWRRVRRRCAMATSPAMVIQLKTELRAEGKVTQHL